MGITTLLATNSYILVNKKLAWIIGFREAALFGELCGEHDYWERSEKLVDGYFYSTSGNIQRNTTFGETNQRKLITKLCEVGLIDSKRMGQNGYRYFKINEDKLIELMNSDVEILKNKIKNDEDTTSENFPVPRIATEQIHAVHGTEPAQSTDPDPRGARTNNNIYNNTNLKNTNLKSTSPSVTRKSLSEKIYNNTLKEKQKEIMNLRKNIKDQIELAEKVPRDSLSLDLLVNEKLTDIDNEQARKKKEEIIQQEVQRKITQKEKIKLRAKKCRLEEAAKHFNKEIVDLLDEYLDMYQETYNVMSTISWKYILDETSILKDNPGVLASCIKDSITKAYRKIYIPNNVAKDATKNSLDVKPLREMTEEELKTLEENLARNPDGSLMEF